MKRSLVLLTATWSVTSVLAWLTSITDAVPLTGMSAWFACLVTDSGSARWVAMPLIGSLLILLVDSGVPPRLRKRQVGRLFILLSVALPLSALVNERFVKRTLQCPRPSHHALAEAQFIPNLEAFYRLPTEDRHAVLDPLLDPPGAFEVARRLQIDTRVLTHWVHEVSSSFPSGHALNAFLAATFFALVAAGRRTRVGDVVSAALLTWATAVACSRVLLGVHHPVDVSVGAALGIVLGVCVGWLFLCITPQERVDS